MRRRLTWRQIEAFRAVMLRGTVSGAAQMMNMTQPAVSRLVRDMEDSLGYALFSRVGGQVTPTPEAALLHQEVAMSFVSLARIERTALDIRRGQRGALRISAMAGPALSLLPRLVAGFMRAHPDTYVSIHNNTTPVTLERVSLRQYDVGLCYVASPYPGLEIEPLDGLEALCVLPTGHPLARRRVVRLTDLQGERLLSLGLGSQVGLRLDTLLRMEGIGATVAAEASASEVLCSLVAEGAGLALIDPFTAANLRDPALRVRRFEPAIAYGVAMVFPEAVPRSVATARLSEMIREAATMPALLRGRRDR
ncbi:LysR substrate-binding domain-containing protein [Pseudoroseomonas globiformis]|uniref:LysR substrate-binding domain-containing protein n=1 Tax=Teichococcus globiformis TaxID=2307229 RepID=A0ABV7G3D8_9PROT